MKRILSLLVAAAVMVPVTPAFADSEERTDHIPAGPSPVYPPDGPSAAPNAHTLADGSVVRVEVAPEYANDAILQRLLTRLGSLMHGSEMNRLTVYIATPALLDQACRGATACYFPFDQTMVVPGGSTENSMPFEMLVAHEYAHHIERSLSTDGWNAIHLGGRHWSTYENVCEGVNAGQLFPGDQSANYWENPGEAFAQAYAFQYYPYTVPWWWSFAAPDEGAYEAIVADAFSTGMRRAKWARRLGPGASRVVKTVRTPLDGPLEARLQEPRSGNFKLVALSPEGRVLSRARPKPNRAKGASQVEVLRYNVCSQESVRLEVRRTSGDGRFKVKISRP